MQTLFPLMVVLFHGSALCSRNLFFNGGFEFAYPPEMKYAQFWTCTGDSFVEQPMLQTSKDPLSGVFKGVCNNRKKTQEGPGQNIESVIVPDHIYMLDGWTRLVNAKSPKELASLQLWIKWMNKSSNAKVERKKMGLRGIYLNNFGWTKWHVQFHIPIRNYEYIIVYFHGPRAGIDIEIDSMTLQHVPHNKNWKELADKEIERHRTRNLTIRMIFNDKKYEESEMVRTKLQVRQLTHEFGFGAAVHYDALVHNIKYKDFMKHNFEWATMESSLKWYNMEPREGKPLYNRTDTMVTMLTDEMGINVRGHCIYWELPDRLPVWLRGANSTAIKRAVITRLHDVVRRYKNKFKHWDVNNEMLHGSFFSERVSPKIQNWMYRQAHIFDPRSKLFLNDYDVLASPLYTQAYYEQIVGFKRVNVPIDGVGVQGHFSGVSHPEIIKDRLDLIASAGLPIWITEMDVVEENETRRADTFETVMRVSFSHPAVQGIVLWTWWDQHQWRGPNSALFVGENFIPNAVGRRYLMLRDKWKTTSAVLMPQVRSSKECIFKLKAFFGKHVLHLTLPDGEIIEKAIYVNSRPNPLLIELKTFPGKRGQS